MFHKNQLGPIVYILAQALQITEVPHLIPIKIFIPVMGGDQPNNEAEEY